jgi:hypothetical protein
MDSSVKKAALAIMRVFRDKQIETGGVVGYAEFGSALKWEAGAVKHDNQREALRYLVERGFVNETNAGLELTRKGEETLGGL